MWAKLFQSWGPFLKKYVPHSMPIFKKKSHPIHPVEGLKLCLDFLCNMDTPRALTIKDVYGVSYSGYGYIIGRVCMVCMYIHEKLAILLTSPSEQLL